MSHEIVRTTDHAVVMIDGDLDSAEVQDIRPGLDVVLGAGHPVIFDLTKVEFIDSSGIGLIVHAYKTLRAKRAKVVVSGASEQPLELLKATQLDRFVPFKTNLEEARAAIT